MNTVRVHQTVIKHSAAALLLGAVMALAASCESVPKPPVEGWKDVRGQTFFLWMPPAFETQTPPTSGFNQYCLFEPLADNQKPMTLNIVEGYEFAGFFSTRKEKQEQLRLIREKNGDARVGPFQGREVAGRDAKGGYWRELFLKQPDQIATLHIWYFEASKEKAAQFDSVIRTLQIRIRK